METNELTVEQFLKSFDCDTMAVKHTTGTKTKVIDVKGKAKFISVGNISHIVTREDRITPKADYTESVSYEELQKI